MRKSEDEMMKFIKTKLKKRILVVYLVLIGIGAYIYFYFDFVNSIKGRSLYNFYYKICLSANDLDEGHSLPYKYNFTFIYKAEQTCASERAPFLIFLVKSKVSHFSERDVIRHTWAQLDPSGLIRRVFLVGMPNPQEVSAVDSKAIDEKLRDENKQYGDIVQQDFYDAYFNNTLQALMGIRWATEYCTDAKFYSFIDEDMYLNPKLLVKYLTTKVNSRMYSSFYAGYVHVRASPARNRISKWYISEGEYPYKKYPPYVSGSFYTLTPSSLELVSVAARKLDLFKFDDVYVGILAFSVGIEPVFMPRVAFDHVAYDPDKFAHSLIASHKVYSNELLNIWNEIGESIKFDPADVENYLESN